MKKQVVFAYLFFASVSAGLAQTKTLGLEEAVQLGVQNSRQLKLSQSITELALTQVEQAKDAALPSAKVSAGYSHALMLNRTLGLFSSDPSKPLKLPFDNTLYQVTAGITEPIIAGHQFRYARQSADLLLKMSKLDVELDRDEVVYNIISAYINLYKIVQNQKILSQNLQDIENKLDEITKYEAQGLATRNDVLRYQLQKSNTELSAIELENNRSIANYNMNVMLGLGDSTRLELQDVIYKLDMADQFKQFLNQALRDRKEFSSLQYQGQLADLDVNKIHDQRLPTVALAGNLYYFNLSKALIPKSGDYLAPFVVGINASWDISSLYKNKNKVAEAKVKREQVNLQRDILSDRIKTEVNQRFTQYKQVLEKIKVLQDAIVQATENERIMESKFHNNLATTTDRIDAQTLLYQSRINLELAKADATIAYYDLMKSIGHIQP